MENKAKAMIEARSKVPFIGTAFRPVQLSIRRSEAAELYAAEEVRNGSINRCVHEWMRVTGFDPSDEKAYWSRGLPQALYDALDSYDNCAAEAAAVALLEHRGYQVTSPSGERRQEIIEEHVAFLARR